MAAYRAMWHDLTVASETSDASSSLLNDHARGDAVALMKFGLKKSKAEGVVGKGRVRLAPEVVTATGGKVTLRDCVDSRRWLQYRLDGRLKNDVPGGHHKADATVENVDGSWRVSRFYLGKAGSC
ncbi:hypothetical protein [Streptomyces sp. NPDC102360]|uniref:hypothetical protein n=1 Tax=Streptomyces sp. NPDC102360 TaxID=3366160 RepID=UPI003809E88A